MPALRPSAYNQRTRSNGGPFFLIEPHEEAVDTVDVIFSDAPAEAFNPDTRAALLMTVTPDHVTIYPLNVRDDREDYLTPKYGSLESIMITRPVIEPYRVPATPEDVVDLLEQLPEGFSKDFQFGLGLLWEYRAICETIARLEQVSVLIVAGGSAAQIDPPFYHLGVRRFHELRRDLNRIARRHQRDALQEKNLSTYTALLHDADSAQFPAKRLRLRKDALADMTHGGRDHAELSKRDQSAVVKMVQDSVSTLAKNKPSALLALKSDIELVTLEQLIERYQAMLEKDLTEPKWQRFLQENPFILSLAFAVPPMLIKGNAYVGGTRIDRNGGKFADFLLANAATGNLAIIEIKRPNTALLTRTEYRDDVFSPSPDLSGAITQVLDQRYRMQRTISVLKEESDRSDIFAYAIRCVVIAGRLPEDAPQKKSLELARNALNGVAVITYDELLGRLVSLRNALTPEPLHPLACQESTEQTSPLF